MENLGELGKYRKVHMVGIGGVSMSGIAEILTSFGVNVTGSTLEKSPITEMLEKNNITVYIGHNQDNIKDCDVVVYTASIKPDNIELVTAREHNIPTIERGDFLGLISKLYKESICISGTHGKTTTTSMISLCFMEANLDPTIQVGALLKPLNANYRVGNSDYFIIEACEYVESYLKLFPKTEIILNIDNDHLDYFKNFENIKTSFINYAKLLPPAGLLVTNADDSTCLEVASTVDCNVSTYGIKNPKADYFANNINMDDNGFFKFDVYYKNELWDTFKLSVLGIHNVLNALACIATCTHYNISKEDIKTALLKFTGANRRFEYIGTFNQVSVFDDYAHHPTEINATYEALKNKKYHEAWVVFQPHTYSRTKAHLKEFAQSLLKFNHVIITDIYAARETNEYGISSVDLVNELLSLGKKDVEYISSFEDIVKYLREHSNPNDIVLTLGAGTVTEIGPKLL